MGALLPMHMYVSDKTDTNEDNQSGIQVVLLTYEICAAADIKTMAFWDLKSL